MKFVAEETRIEKQHLITRPDYLHLPDWQLPLYPRSTGTTFFGRGGLEQSSGRRSPFVQLNWCIRGCGTMLADDQPVEVSEGDVVIQMPFARRHNIARSDDWQVRWLVWDGPEAGAFMAAYGYPAHLRAAGPCPDALFDDFETGLKENTLSAMRRNLATICAIVARSGERSETSGESHNLIQQFIALAQADFSDPAVNLNVLCDRLGVHRSTLSKIFTPRMQISPGKFLAQLRVQHALYLLRSTRIPIADIARQCGFSDPSHFSQVINRATEHSPGVFRRSIN